MSETPSLLAIVERAEREGDLDALRAHIARAHMSARAIKRLLTIGVISADLAGVVREGVLSYEAERARLDAADTADQPLDDDRDVDAPDGRSA